ncbi:MAG: SLBB domain-containing protein, partial [Desulfuromonadales bacterium]|nr:SLBB domain-containing protein [Desulfuromonadales bacterium]
LATLPWIVQKGGSAYARFGTEWSHGTHMFGISGHIAKPGLYEREAGYPLKKIIMDDAGGIRDGKKLKAVIPGGSSTPVLKADEIEEITLDPESLQEAGSLLGSGAIIVVAEGTCMVRLLQVLTRFYSHESCGQCTPCREGTNLLHTVVSRIVDGKGFEDDVERLERATKGIKGNTVCALGDAAAMPVQSFVSKFRDEFDHYIKYGHSMHDGRLDI